MCGWGVYLLVNGVLLTIVTGQWKSRQAPLWGVFIFRSAGALFARNNSRINLEWVTSRLDPRQNNTVQYCEHVGIFSWARNAGSDSARNAQYHFIKNITRRASAYLSKMDEILRHPSNILSECSFFPPLFFDIQKYVKPYLILSLRCRRQEK